MKNPTNIDFFGIGAQKAGTTWLFYNLKKIPQFDLLPIKELHYFDRSIKYVSPNLLTESKPLNRFRNKKYRSLILKTLVNDAKPFQLKNWLFYFRFCFKKTSDLWYLSLFQNRQGITGEISPSYSMLNIEDIQKMHNVSPSAKIIFILRNPIERAWSHYRFQCKNDLDFYKMNDNQKIVEFINSKEQTQRSDYMNTIKNFSQVFQKNQILLCFYDAIKDNPRLLLSEICTFINPSISFDLSKTETKKIVHKSREIKMPNDVKELLKTKYHHHIKELSNSFGGYCDNWFNVWYENEKGVSRKNVQCTIKLK